MISGLFCGFIHGIFGLYFMGNFVDISKTHIITRSSESDGRSDVTDSFECPDKLRVP